MGTIIQEIEIARSQDLVWDAIRDVGEIISVWCLVLSLIADSTEIGAPLLSRMA